MNKKGQLQIVTEVADGFKVMFAFILVVVVLSMLLVNFASQAGTIDAFQSSTLTPVITKMNEYPVFMDWAALLLFGVTVVLTVYAMSQIESNVVLYVVAWIGILILSFALIAVGYALETIVNSGALANVTANMIFIPFYASNAFLFAVFYFFASLIALHTPKQ